MTSGTAILLASSTLATALGLVASAGLVARARRTMPEDIEGRAATLARLRKQRVRVAFWVALFPLALVTIVSRDRVTDAGLFVILGSCLVFDLATAPAVLALHAEIRGPRWSVRLARAVHRWTLATTLGVPLLAALGVAAVRGMGPVEDPEGWAFTGHALGVLAGVVLISTSFRRLGRVEPLPEGHAAPLRATFAADVPRLSLLRTGEGMWNAFAVGVRRSRRGIVVSEDLLDLLSPPEVHAVLCHEMGHHRLRHVATRALLLLFAWFVPAACLALAGALTPSTAAIGPALGPVLVGWFYRRQERAADAFAAGHAPAADLGAALVRMTRAQLLPATERVEASHPALRERLEALGLPATPPGPPSA